MFGIGSIELLVLAVAALLFVGPKELPGLMRTVGRFVGKIRAYTRHFTAGIDAVVREAEMEEMEKQWKAQNAAIMAEFPPEQFTDTMLPLDRPDDAPKDDAPKDSAADAPKSDEDRELP